MTKSINDLRNEGVEIGDEILTEFSPYRTEHINRYGVFSLSMDREAMALEYDLILIEKRPFLSRIPAGPYHGMSSSHIPTSTLSLFLLMSYVLLTGAVIFPFFYKADKKSKAFGSPCGNNRNVSQDAGNA